MVDVSTTTQAISLLPLLEPLAGSSFAINLAYLFLERFRYRQNIRSQAQSLYDVLSNTAYFDNIEHLGEVELLRELSGLRDNDNMGNDPLGEAEESEPAERDISVTERIYKIIFKHHWDMKICRTLTVLSAVLLYFGVMHSVERHAYLAPMFNEPWEAHLWGEILLASLVLPLALVITGNWMVGKLKKKATKAYRQMEKLADSLAGNAELNRSLEDFAGGVWATAPDADDDVPF